MTLFGKEETAVPAAEALFLALARAEDRVSRLDERVRASGFLEGWRQRADVRAVIAALAAEGTSVHPEDLLLHDLAADVRPPDATVAGARRLLLARRKAGLGGPELLSWSGVAWLSARTRQAPPPGARPSVQLGTAADSAEGYSRLVGFFEALEKGDSESARAGVEDCLAVLDVPGIPSLLQAAALMEAWRVVSPLPRDQPIGGLAAAVLLMTSGRFACGLLPLEVGLRHRPLLPRLAWAPLAERLAFWIGVLEACADLELEELTRLGHKRAIIERKAAGGRRSSRGPALARLAVESPVLTTELIARSLAITPQASLQLVRRMEGALQEITGRSRYRVWRL